MTRRGAAKLVALAAVATAVGGALLVRAGTSTAQPGKVLARGNAYGEWRHWGADQWSTRYSPLDLINASNFDSLEVAGVEGRRVRQGRVLSHHAALCERSSVHRGEHATGGHGARSVHRRNVVDVSSRRRHSLAEGTAAICRTRSVVLDRRHEGTVAAGHAGLSSRFARCKDRSTGCRVRKSGVVDLMEGLGYPMVPLAVDDSVRSSSPTLRRIAKRSRERRGIR